MSDPNSVRPTYWSHPGFIIAVALALRLIWAACVAVDPVSDGVLYDAFARSIVAGSGYAFADGTATEYWPVGTSAIYALLYWIFGMHPWVVPVFQALLGACIVGLTWNIARRTLSLRVAALAAWLTAIWPLLIEFTTILASELLFITLVLASINIWMSRRLPFALRMISWGACLASATYVRPTAFLMLFIFLILQLTLDRDWRRFLLGGLLAVLTASLLFAPWTYRSIVLFDKFVVVSANGGVNLWMGNNPDSTGGYMELPERVFTNEVDRDQYYGREAVHFILSHPLSYAKLSLKRLIATYDRETIGVVWNEKGLASRYPPSLLLALKGLSSAYWWTMLVAGLMGLLIIVRRRLATRLWPVLACFSYFSIFPVLTVSMDRYHVPIDPLLAIFVAYGVLVMLKRESLPEMQHAETKKSPAAGEQQRA